MALLPSKISTSLQSPIAILSLFQIKPLPYADAEIPEANLSVTEPMAKRDGRIKSRKAVSRVKRTPRQVKNYLFSRMRTAGSASCIMQKIE